MLWLILGLAAFLLPHSLSIWAPQWRNTMAARLGEGPWKGLYSLVAAAGLALLIWGYGQARLEPVVLWTPPTAMRHVAALLLVPVFPLALASLLPGRIQAAVKHPLLLAVKIWATAHLLSNGMLADLLLFGAFLAWAVTLRVVLKRRGQRPIRTAPPSGLNDPIAVVGGLVLYGLFVWKLHAALIGVSPMGL